MATNEKTKNTRQQLLESAAILFSEKGYANTSVAEICKMAGANIASVNYYFGNKDELYRSVIRYTYEQAENLYPLQLDGEEKVEKRLYALVFSLLKRILSKEMQGNFYQLVAKEMAEPTTASGTLITEIITIQRQRVRQLIQEVYGKPADDEFIFRMTHSIISQCLFLGLHEKGRQHHLKKMPVNFDDAEGFARHITDFSLAGIRWYDK